VRLAQIGEVYDIRPIAGIDHVIAAFKDFFEYESDVSCLAVTYSYSADIIGKLQKIATNMRVFCGRATKVEMIRGAVVSPASTHFKGIMMWSEKFVAYYVGSSNLTNESGGNYGVFVTKRDIFNFFDLWLDSVSEYSYGDPFLAIFNEIVFKETRGICEYSGKPARRLMLDRGKFRGVEGVE